MTHLKALIKKSFLFTLIVFLGCKSEKEEYRTEIVNDSKKIFELLSPEQTGIDFYNKVVNKEKFNIFSYRNFYNGGGVGIIDVNNDGLKDIILTGNQTGNKLYLNKGNFEFEDITTAAGLDKSNNWSTGVAIVDINQDGFHDIYICNAGYTDGISQANELFINNGDNTFTEQAAEFGLDDAGYTTHAVFFDYDGDGDLDVYILNNSFIPVNTLNYSNKRELYAEDWDVKEFVKGGGDKLLRNDNGKFIDVSREAGIYGSLIGFGLGVMVGDVNGDNRPDIFVANDFFERDYLYINQGNGTFREEGTAYMSQMSLASMGADMADIDNDGYPEIFTTEMLPQSDEEIKQKLQFDSYNTFKLKLTRDFHYQYMQNTLQLNNQNGTFSEISWYAGVAQSDWSWGALIFDGNLDGFKDLFVCNGVYQDVTDTDFMDFFANEVVQQMVLTGTREDMSKVLEKIPSNPQANKYYKNNGDYTFTSVEKEIGLGDLTFSNGAAYADLNNDGAPDLVINNLNQPSHIYKNHIKKLEQPHHISVNLKYVKPNIDGIGTQVFVYSGPNVFHQHHMPARGFQSSVDYTLHFGLGKHEVIDSIEVLWPNHMISSIYNISADTLVDLQYDNMDKRPWKPRIKEKNVFAHQVSHNFAKHKEDAHVDFYHEGLIIKKLSREAAPVAVADLNGNGLDDLVMGNALNQPTRVYFQNISGKFEEYILTGSEEFEDTCIHLFDADGDGKTDIIIGSGGNHQPFKSNAYKVRLYLNKGKNRFEYVEQPSLHTGFNTAVIVSLDYDGDGDLDLFIGSRSIPQNYGSDPQSFLLENDGMGNFTDMTLRRAREISNIGMVTDATLADLEGDGLPELVVVGEWMGIEIFSIQNRQLTRLTQDLQKHKGWWYSVKATDLNNNGKDELIIGNRGTNFYFNGTSESPAKLWLADFDGNGDTEKIITRRKQDKDFPIHIKAELFSQLPSLKKENLKNVDYSKKSMKELFTEEQRKSAIVKEANYFYSAVASFASDVNIVEVVPLPAQAQFSSIHAIYTMDFNNDGITDLFIAGNDSHFIPQFSKLDANQGLLLRGKGDFQFETLPKAQQSFNISGDIKQIEKIRIKGSPHIIVTINDQSPELYKID
ncbi:MAG: VCBS repeat-containing protein [Cyclobacteriaceae bacterium]|nr:VCBS repeat-containing protein [Cyclobacteriaceae bacterium]